MSESERNVWGGVREGKNKEKSERQRDREREREREAMKRLYDT